ncbi:hypothetical protein [Sphingopyxis granuli]|uniref:hypothetical protein n=1 Tax=Sphingopyxis granuli TaxID=267128 RepID=UPI00301BBF63
MFEPAGRREMIGPGLCPARQLVVPAQGGNPHERALAVVAVEEAIIERAQARLRAGRNERDGRQKRDFSCLEADVLHAQIPETREKLSQAR